MQEPMMMNACLFKMNHIVLYVLTFFPLRKFLLILGDHVHILCISVGYIHIMPNKVMLCYVI